MPRATATTYEAAVVKRADGCTTGAGWPSVKQIVSRRSQAIAADLISVAGHSLRLHHTPIEGRYSLTLDGENSSARRPYALETLLCPHVGLLKLAGWVVRHSW